MDSSIPPIEQKVKLNEQQSTFLHHGARVAMNDDPDQATTSGVDSPTGKAAARPAGIMYKLSSLLGMSDTTPGVEVLSSDSIEMQLLGERPVYTSLRHIHNRMRDSQVLLPIKDQLNDWFREVLEPVRQYMNRLIMHVLKLKHAKMKGQAGGHVGA